MTNSSLNLLLAEDNQDDVILFRMALDKANVPVQLQIVCDGEQAVEYLKGEGKYSNRSAHPIPDMVLLDLNMPRRNGFEVLEWIRNDDIHKHLMVHVFTASSRAVDVLRAYELWATSYVIKPSRMNDLGTFIQGLIAWQKFVSLPKLPLSRAEAIKV